MLGGGGDPIDPVAEVDPVEVGGQDLVLAQVPLELDGVQRLDQLAVQAAAVSGDHVLDVLLGEVAAPLADVAADHVGDRRPGDAAQVEGAVGVEAGVLDRQDGVADRHRHRRQRDHCAVLVAVEYGQDRPVGGADHRAGRRRGQQPAERMGVATDLKGGGRGHPSRRQHPGQGQAAQDHAGHHEQQEQPGQGPPPVGVWRRRWVEPAHRATQLRPPCASTTRMPISSPTHSPPVQPIWCGGAGRFRTCRRSRRPWSRPSRPSAPAPSGRSSTGSCGR